jgi:hypothetical protein
MGCWTSPQGIRKRRQQPKLRMRLENVLSNRSSRTRDEGRFLYLYLYLYLLGGCSSAALSLAVLRAAICLPSGSALAIALASMRATAMVSLLVCIWRAPHQRRGLAAISDMR